MHGRCGVARQCGLVLGAGRRAPRPWRRCSSRAATAAPASGARVAGARFAASTAPISATTARRAARRWGVSTASWPRPARRTRRCAFRRPVSAGSAGRTRTAAPPCRRAGRAITPVTPPARRTPTARSKHRFATRARVKASASAARRRPIARPTPRCARRSPSGASSAPSTRTAPRRNRAVSPRVESACSARATPTVEGPLPSAARTTSPVAPDARRIPIAPTSARPCATRQPRAACSA
jgi:hypothetical protein